MTDYIAKILSIERSKLSGQTMTCFVWMRWDTVLKPTRCATYKSTSADFLRLAFPRSRVLQLDFFLGHYTSTSYYSNEHCSGIDKDVYHEP